MTREEFIGVLEEKGYSYEIVGDKIVVTAKEAVWGNVYLKKLKTLPSGVVFNNVGNVWLDSLETLPPDVEFNNGGGIDLHSLNILPPGVVFKNRGAIDLSSLQTISPDVEFKNGWDVDLRSLIGGRFGIWKGNIEGVDSKRLLNYMISKGMFI